MIDFLEGNDYCVVFKWIDKGRLGLVDPQTDTVFINIELLLAETLVHEAIHVKHPDWSEEEVEMKTVECIGKMKSECVRKLGEKLIKRYLIQRWGEPQK